MTEELPEGWVREFEGRHRAEYFHEPRVVSVQVIPRYDPPKGRASQSEPSEYLVRFRRPFSDRVGFPIELDTVGSFQEALGVAREFMTAFSERFVAAEARRAAADSLTAVAEYSDDRLVDLLRDRSAGGVRAVVRSGPAGVDPLYGVESDGTVGGVPVEDLVGRVRDASDDLTGAVDAGETRATVAVLAGATVLWIPDDGGGILVALDPDAEFSVPGLIEECTELLERRE